MHPVLHLVIDGVVILVLRVQPAHGGGDHGRGALAERLVEGDAGLPDRLLRRDQRHLRHPVEEGELLAVEELRALELPGLGGDLDHQPRRVDPLDRPDGAAPLAQPSSMRLPPCPEGRDDAEARHDDAAHAQPCSFSATRRSTPSTMARKSVIWNSDSEGSLAL